MLVFTWNILSACAGAGCGGIIPGSLGLWNGRQGHRHRRSSLRSCRRCATIGPLWDLEHVEEVAAASRRSSDTSSGAGGFLERLSVSVFGMLSFISSEVFFFGALIITFILYRSRSLDGPGPAELVGFIPRTAVFSLLLFASSATIMVAERRLAKADHRGFLNWLLATLVLGAIFLFGQITEYSHLFAQDFTLGRNLFTSRFFYLTGFHGLHVAVGLIALAVCLPGWH